MGASALDSLPFDVLGYPLALMGVETGFEVGGLKKRFDVVVCRSSERHWFWWSVRPHLFLCPQVPWISWPFTNCP
jgi:hypothetical protein